MAGRRGGPRRCARARPGLEVELVVIDDLRRPAPGRPGLGDGRPGGVRQGGAGGGARRAGRPRRPLGQGPAVVDARGPGCWPPSPAGPTPATPWSGPRLADLRPGARVATGSVRRRAQLAWVRPDLTFAGLRGNIAHPARPGPRRRGGGRGRRRPGPPRPARPGRRDPATARHAPAGGPGRHRRRVPGRRRRRPGPPLAAIDDADARDRGDAPSGPFWPASAAAAICRSGPSRPASRGRHPVGVDGLMASARRAGGAALGARRGPAEAT